MVVISVEHRAHQPIRNHLQCAFLGSSDLCRVDEQPQSLRLYFLFIFTILHIAISQNSQFIMYICSGLLMLYECKYFVKVNKNNA